MDLFYKISVDEEGEEEEEFESSKYRVLYSFGGKYYCYIDSIFCFYDSDVGSQARIKYCHEKVYMLSEYIQEKSIRDKIWL